MRKNLIAMSVAAFVGGLGMAGGAAAAVFADVGGLTPTDATREDVRQSGTGHQLIVPYFNTQNGNATLFNIVNTDLVNAKAVKIRFRGASNSDDIFDFQLYMSPGDVWAANISKGANGISTLTTTDRSCTIPSLVGKDPSGTQNTFVTGRLPTQLLSGDALAAETREGYIEIFNMADIPPLQPNADGTASASASTLFTTVKHNSSGVAPCSSTELSRLETDPATLAAARALGFRAPTTGLFANWTIVNVPKSGSSSGEAIALTAVIPNLAPGINTTPARGNIVFFPQVNGTVANVDNFTADPALRTTAGAGPTQVQNGFSAPFSGTTPIVVAQFFDLPDLSTPYLLTTPGTSPQDPITSIEALARALATSSVSNEYITDKSINAFTDWVLSQPTRRYAVAADYRPLPGGPILRAFTANPFYDGNSTVINADTAKRYQICASTASFQTFDREEREAVASSRFVVSPSRPTDPVRLCGEVSVAIFNSDAASVLGATVAVNRVTAVGVDGWARLATPGATNIGLPIIGKAFVSAATTSFNIGASWEHRYVPTAP